MYSTGARQALIVDRMSSARRLADDELRGWAETRGMFISSVMSELATERRELAPMIEGLGATPILFEDLGDPVAQFCDMRACRLWFDRCG